MVKIRLIVILEDIRRKNYRLQALEDTRTKENDKSGIVIKDAI